MTLFPGPAWAVEMGVNCRALFDGRAWEESAALRGISEERRIAHLNRLFKAQGQADWAIADQFALALSLLPEFERAQWIELIAKDLRAYPKIGDRSDRRIGGRRSLERVLSLMLNRGGEYLKALEAGETPLQAYERLFNEQAKLFGSEYRAHDLLKIARYLQAELAKIPPPGAEDGHHIILAGSLVNATARATSSDLDIMGLGEGLERELKRWQADIQSMIRARVPGSRIALENHKSAKLILWRALNPFAIEIHAAKIKLLVFTPAARDPHDPGRLVPQPPREFILSH